MMLNPPSWLVCKHSRDCGWEATCPEKPKVLDQQRRLVKWDQPTAAPPTPQMQTPIATNHGLNINLCKLLLHCYSAATPAPSHSIK